MDLKIFTSNIENSAIDQINELVNQDAFKDCKIRIMPDVHAGKGCVIGFTADLGDKVIPNIVGVDIGCGMLAIKLGRRAINLEKIDDIIKASVPSGMNVHSSRKNVELNLESLNCFRELKDTKRIERGIGTLGGGNHFIEIDEDEKGEKWLVIHSGSRNLGKQVAEYYQNLAIDLHSGKRELFEERDRIIKEYKEQGRKTEIQDAIKELYRNHKSSECDMPKELCYLDGEYREKYLHDMMICQDYAKENRRWIAKEILENYYGAEYTPQCSIETVHNYINFEDNIVRKGAISAKKGETVIIPMNMRDGSLICVGKGNEEWNCSAPHGAGRVMSRAQAREKITMEEFEESMKGICSTTVCENTIDESPMAYKPMQEIVDNIKDTVDVISIIKPIYNFKASM